MAKIKMKLSSYTLAKKDFLQNLQNQAKQHEKEISTATDFVKEIEKGNLDVEYNDIVESEGNVNGLAVSLISMRDQMKRFSEEEKERNWATEGLAKFVEILRSKNDDLSQLADNIIRNLIRYLHANQGALYLINDDVPADVHIEMVSCYAYNRKKHLTQRIELGEGLTGQVVLEKDVLYLTEVPADYVKITSGLGEALPRNILMVPLMLDSFIYGVVEVASFEKIKPHQIEFVKKLGESIAATISSVKINERTKKLLNETQQQTEQMRAQEEEMRQNMEELSATQEEMHRILQEVQGKEGYLSEILNASRDSIFTLDTDFKIISSNQAFNAALEVLGMKVDKGFDILNIFQHDKKEQDKQQSYYKRAFGGETFEVTDFSEINGVESCYSVNYSPMRKENGEVFAIAVFAKDITELMKTQKKAETLAFESQQRNEELKAQEEELRQNMEELSSTQEEMQRILQRVQSNEKDITELLNVIGDSILTIDRDFKVVRFNEVFASTFESKGISIAPGFNILSIFNSEDQKNKTTIYNRVFQGEEVDIIDHLDTAGFDNYYNVKHAPLRDESGEITAIAIFAKEITEIVKAKETAERLLNDSKNQQAYYNNIINGLGDSVLSVDRDFKIVVANTAFKNIFSKYGVSTEPGASLLTMSTEAEREEFKKPYLKAFEGETIEVPHRHHFDRDFHVLYTPLKDSEGTIIGVSLIAHDITQRLALQRKTEELLKESQEISNKEKSRAETEITAQKLIVRQTTEKFEAKEEEYKMRIAELQSLLQKRTAKSSVTN